MSREKTSTLPDLEERFLEPEGWQWHNLSIESVDDNSTRNIRLGCVSPQGGQAKATVICLPGLSEFSEKYFETARDITAQNMDFWVIDWAGHGYSSRYLDNPHKRHSAGFQRDIDDLDKIIAFIQTQSEQLHPLIMLAHSMGGNIGLRYIADHPDKFTAAGFSAPMLGIKVFEYVHSSLARGLTSSLATINGDGYVFGGGNWDKNSRNAGHDIFSHDPARGALHNTWMESDPDLRVGDITFGWLSEAVKSCHHVQSIATLDAIQTHFLIAIAGDDSLVDNKAIVRVTRALPHATLLPLEGARHEILMECDEYRQVFLDAFYKYIHLQL